MMDRDQLWDVAMVCRPACRLVKLPNGDTQLQRPTAIGGISIDGHKVVATIEWVWLDPDGYGYVPANRIGGAVLQEKLQLPVDIVRSPEEQDC